MTINAQALQALILVSDHTPTGDSLAACHARTARREAVKCFLAGDYSATIGHAYGSLVHSVGVHHPDTARVREMMHVAQ